MKKQKLIIKIISIVLIVLLLFGLVATCIPVQHVHAAEINDATEETQTSSENNRPTQNLPDGFEYVQNGEYGMVQKTSDNTKPAIIIDGKPEGFDALAVTVFVGNLETHEVTYYTLDSTYNYVSSMNLNDGYYVIFGNGFAWCTSNGDAYTINGGYYQYIYVGDNYDPTLYGVEFQTGDDIFSIHMDFADDTMQKIAHNSYLTVDSNILVYPEDAKLEKLNNNGIGESTQSGLIDVPKPTLPQQEEEKDPITLLDILINTVKRSWVLLLSIAVCFVGLTVIDLKKKSDIKKQAEIDSYDETRIE